MSEEYELPQHIKDGIKLTERHYEADRAIAYSMGVLESALYLFEDDPTKSVLRLALAPLRQYEHGLSEPPESDNE